MKTNPYKPPKHEGDCQTKEYKDQQTIEWFRKYYKYIIAFDIIVGVICIVLVFTIAIGLLW